MEYFKKKIITFICMMFVGMSLVVAQTNTTKHTVERGETLASIAKRYATTEAKIIELNPDAAQFVYVGMELIIPIVSPNFNNETIAVSRKIGSSRKIPLQSEADNDNELSLLKNNSLKKYEFKVFAGFSINNFTGKDAKNTDMICGFHAGVSFGYNFYENIFVECSIGIATKGYKLDTTMSSGDYWDDEGANYDSSTSTKYLSYNVDLPVLIGYNFFINDVSNLKIKVGPYMTYVISGKKTVENYTTIYPDIHSSETESIKSETKVGNMKGFKRMGYGVYAGISADYKSLVLSASYQRGLSKVFDKSKEYEQNILLSIGYRF